MTQMMRVFDGINFRKSPYRGILSEVAAERGTTLAALRQSVLKRNPKVVAAITAKIREVQATLQESNELSKAA